MGMLATHAAATKSNGHANDRIKSYAPATGELLGEVPVMGPDAVRAAVDRARRAQVAWGALTVEDRCKRVLRFRDAIVDREEELTDLLSRETGKPLQEALVHEVSATATVATYFAKKGPEILAPRDVPLALLKHRKAVLHYVPRGVVACITPWNFPFYMPFRDIFLALIAGNAVVLKPSEVTPLIALKAKDLWDQCGMPADLFQVVTGYGPTGAAVIDAGVNFVVFTGGVATGRRVAAACGERLIPCVMELGGKAPLVVCRDADVELAARGAVFGGFSNAGQVCISVERVYAHKDVADALTKRMTELTKGLRVGDPSSRSVDVGAIIFPKQIEVAEDHIKDAVSKGAKVLAGGKRVQSTGQFFEPTLLGDCNHSMTVMTEEIFGPIVPIMKVDSDEEAVRLANQSHLGLNAYVFTKDRDYGERIAQRIEAGSVLVNDVLTNGGCPETPFGGIKQSGFGRVMGDDSLREMCDVRHVNVERVGIGSDNPMWFPYSDKGLSLARKATKLLFGGGGLLKKLANIV
ncbi:MAG: aldehyde dehydrogenase family protein [Polyangiaceae bacterium]|nr:aldehyde dehydrogenase family protein [Polyangiaceae bacterium]